jgi:hypothetical protein
VICSLHFTDADFKTERTDSNSRRKLGGLKSKRLKDSAIPRIFPGLPSYLSSQQPIERLTSSSSATARREKEQQRIDKESENFLLLDKINSFIQLKSNFSSDFPPSWNIITLQVTDFDYLYQSYQSI